MKNIWKLKIVKNYLEKRAKLKEYIESIALDYAVAYSEPLEIDKYNILNTTIRTCTRPRQIKNSSK